VSGQPETHDHRHHPASPVRHHRRCPIRYADSGVEIARATGTLSELALALSARTPVLVFCGDLAAAAASVSETASVEQATGIRAAPYGALMVAAWRGRERDIEDLIEVTEREAGARGEGIGLAISAYARAVLCNALGRYNDALAAANHGQRAPRGRRRELGVGRTGRGGDTLWKERPRHRRA
jgi:hypothetical protein